MSRKKELRCIWANAMKMRRLGKCKNFQVQILSTVRRCGVKVLSGRKILENQLFTIPVVKSVAQVYRKSVPGVHLLGEPRLADVEPVEVGVENDAGGT